MPESTFIKSSYSQAATECVEVAAGVLASVMVRDSKDVDAGLVRIPAEAWGAFLGRVKGQPLG
ncbi:DUF397 domain-containing protein [Streptomyces sp. MS19]|uniref:DUF397 domain-containing protein n=1 Tax=Streptomyces sp. MS19 TaxID=3385972 RepID=UPI0039A34005